MSLLGTRLDLESRRNGGYDTRRPQEEPKQMALWEEGFLEADLNRSLIWQLTDCEDDLAQ